MGRLFRQLCAAKSWMAELKATEEIGDEEVVTESTRDECPTRESRAFAEEEERAREEWRLGGQGQDMVRGSHKKWPGELRSAAA